VDGRAVQCRRLRRRPRVQQPAENCVSDVTMSTYYKQRHEHKRTSMSDGERRPVAVAPARQLPLNCQTVTCHATFEIILPEMASK
jgi:hypothetical protein